MATTIDTAGDAGDQERRLTVAQVRTRPEHAEVMFHETARIYRLPRANPQFEHAVQSLREAMSARTPVRVRFVEPNGEIIEAVHLTR